MLNTTSLEDDFIGRYILKKYSYIPTSRTTKKNIKRLLADQVLKWSPEGIQLYDKPTFAKNSK